MKSGATSNGRKSSRKLPLDTIRDVLADGKVWTSLGIVTRFPGETSHYEIDSEDVLVDVQLIPDKQPILCRLAAGMGAGRGVWFIPSVGTEVIVILPMGEIEADPVIVGCLSTGTVPDGIDASTIVICPGNGGQVLIHDNDSGDAVPLSKADHLHSVTGIIAPGGGGACSGTMGASNSNTDVLKAQ